MNRKYIGIMLLSLISFSTYAQSFKIISYNIRLALASDGENDWQNRKSFFASQINFYEPDIFGVQEATPVQVTDMENLLPDYNSVGMGREGIGKGEASSIYFKKDKFEIKESKTFWLSETPDVISMGWDAACHRICTYALFQEKKTNQVFWVFNTHLDHMGEQARTNGIKLILDVIEKVNTKKHPVIFMGDFNSEPSTERIIELKKVMNDSREISERKPFGPSGTFNGFKFCEPVTKCIDYIFISKTSTLKVKKYAVLSDSNELKYPSDHLPVYIEIEFK